MRNEISVMKITDILALAIKAKDGAAAHPEITLTQNTAAKIQTTLPPRRLCDFARGAGKERGQSSLLTLTERGQGFAAKVSRLPRIETVFRLSRFAFRLGGIRRNDRRDFSASVEWRPLLLETWHLRCSYPLAHEGNQ